jgi:hypothetical protein
MELRQMSESIDDQILSKLPGWYKELLAIAKEVERTERKNKARALR